MAAIHQRNIQYLNQNIQELTFEHSRDTIMFLQSPRIVLQIQSLFGANLDRFSCATCDVGGQGLHPKTCKTGLHH